MRLKGGERESILEFIKLLALEKLLKEKRCVELKRAALKCVGRFV